LDIQSELKIEELRRFIERDLSQQVREITMLSGGAITRAARIETDSQPLFAKWTAGNGEAPRQMFHAEARGLWAIEETGTIRVPKVRWVADDFLLLHFIEPHPRPNAMHHARLGRELARLHRTTITSFGTPVFGFERDTFLGRWRQPNAARGRWDDFFRDSRLAPQIRWADVQEKLPPERLERLKRVLNDVPKYLRGLESVPSLLHGDLWSGNFLIDEHGAPVLFDASVYYGEREIEIAYAELFGGFDDTFFAAYNEEWPLQDGYENRRPLHQLFHLLNHLNHFGEKYGPWIDRTLDELLD
jgi:fructosamine-3-kinase